ncbi:MAG: GatB/YqeY domain-containing protein [Candidatus Krumholzibacteria bacterium]|nr:GatB/YqeY domain-containing protein [Candidatus Krumholzibacteria bacterium]
MKRNYIANKIQEDLKKAVKAGDRPRISTLRMLLSSLKNAELEEREELTEEKEMAVLTGYGRRCKESIEEFIKGERDDLVAKERAELEIVMCYLPEQLSDGEIEKEARKLIEELGASGPRDLGRVMNDMMNRFRGRVDGRTVNRIVLDLLQDSKAND